MLHVSLHFATEKTASFHNRVGWLDIGYENLAPRATYKAKLFVTGLGELPTIRIENYPRWSTTVWDLVLRVITKGLYAEEQFKLDIPLQRKGAFIDHLYAKLEHVADGVDGRRSHVGSASVTMQRTRCNYIASFEDDLCLPRVSVVFRHTPERLQHWDLFARGLAVAMNGEPTVPPRPVLHLPPTVELDDGKKYVSLSQLADPGRIGFPRWLTKKGVVATPHSAAPKGLVPEGLYVEFLRTAV